MSDTHEEDETPRKGRSNAILTYEQIDNIFKTLTTLSVKMDGVDDRLSDGFKALGKVSDDHEVRLRALELTQATFIAAQTGRQQTVVWVLGTVFTLVNTAIAVLGYMNS